MSRKEYIPKAGVTENGELPVAGVEANGVPKRECVWGVANKEDADGVPKSDVCCEEPDAPKMLDVGAEAEGVEKEKDDKEDAEVAEVVGVLKIERPLLDELELPAGN